MSELPSVCPVVIGLGNEDRGDDGCGLVAARRIRSQEGDRVQVAECSGDATRLLDLWEGAERAYVLDAVRSGRAPGTVVRLEAPEIEATALLPPTPSSHGLSLGHAVRLGRSLGRIPGRLIFFGIEAGPVAHGRGLSPAVAAAVDEVVLRVVGELAPPPATHPSRAEVPHA